MIGIDTTFVIDFLKGKPQAKSLAESIANDILVVTPVTITEVFMGIYSAKIFDANELREAAEFFDQVETISISPISAKMGGIMAGELAKSGKMPQVTDAMIASALKCHGCSSIVTHDTDFSRFKDLNVISY